MLIAERVRAFLEESRFAVMATINRSGTPQLTVMWYALLADSDRVGIRMHVARVQARGL